ncbi:MAG: hypothetical protein AVDCRST_MAG49-3720, partial [uncultured Thermomicrobiales bacterium]
APIGRRLPTYGPRSTEPRRGGAGREVGPARVAAWSGSEEARWSWSRRRL